MQNPNPDVVEVEVEAKDNINTISEKISFKPDAVMNGLLHRVFDIEDCAKQYIPAARKSYSERAKDLKRQISDSQKILESEDDNLKLLTMRDLRKTIRDIERHNGSVLPETLEKSLFISLFASFDKYIGDLVAVLYQNKPQLYKSLNKEIQLSEAISYESMDELRQAVLEKEIESIRRKSYIEQFKDLERKFDITLTKFDNWPNFIECAQRRNLFTHCDGVVSKQYLDVCQEVRYNHKINLSVGDQLEIGPQYFYHSCLLIAEVAVMLGHTLWRKILPGDIKEADSHLSHLIYNLLHMEQWKKSISLSKFALGLPKISSEREARIFRVNYAIALNAIGEEKAAKNLLDKKDWSATIYDFKLAYAVITKDYQLAKDIMIKIGTKGEFLVELSYHDWPLFRDFRESEEFLSGYEKVYGYKYSSKLSQIAEDKKADIEKS